MPFSLAGFLVGRVVGERQGITDDAVLNRLSILGGVMGSSPMGLVMTTVLAQREAESTVSAPPTTPSIQIEVPDVMDLSFKEAKVRLESLGLTVVRKDLYSTARKEHILHQTPEPRAIVSQGTTVTVSVSLGSELPTQPPKSGSPDETSDTVSGAKKMAHASR